MSSIINSAARRPRGTGDRRPARPASRPSARLCGLAAALGALLALLAARPVLPGAEARAEGLWQVYLYGNEVTSLAAEGETIWAATSGGLLRLRADGQITQWNRASLGLLSDTLRSVALDRSGRVWAGTATAGVSVFDPAAFAWTPFTSLLEPIPGDRIRHLRIRGDAPAETLLVAAEQGYAVLVDGNLRDACQEGVDICELGSYDIRDILPAGGELWFATAKGVVTSGAQGGLENRSSGLEGAALVRLARADSLYVAGTAPEMRRDSVWVWRGDHWGATGAIPGVPGVYTVHDLLAAGDTLFAATTGGVFRRVGGSWGPVGDLSPFATASGDTVQVTSLARTPSGRLYAGASHLGERKDGIWERTGDGWKQHRIAGPSLRQHYLSILFDEEGTLWLSAAQRRRIPHLTQVRRGDWTVLDGGTEGRLSAWTYRIRELGEDLWLAHCCCEDLAGCRMERVAGKSGSGFRTWPIPNVHDMDVDAHGRLWLATTHREAPQAPGLFVVTPADSSWLQVRTGTAGAQLVSDQLWAVATDDNAVWIGYEDFGVSRWDFGFDGEPLTSDTGERWTHFTEEDTTSGQALIGNAIRRIVRGPDGRVWIGTTSGLSIWSGTSFANIGAGFGRLPFAEINDIVPLEDGGAWVATRNGGVTRLKPRPQGGYFYTTYGPPDLPNPNVEAIALGPDGSTIWLATERGLASFLPPEQSELVDAPEIGAYPNPFRPHCVDGLRLVGTGGEVRGVIVDLSGKVVARFPADGEGSQSPTDPIWDGRDGGRPVASGLYWIRVQTPRGVESIGVGVVKDDCPD